MSLKDQDQFITTSQTKNSQAFERRPKLVNTLVNPKPNNKITHHKKSMYKSEFHNLLGFENPKVQYLLKVFRLNHRQFYTENQFSQTRVST